VLSTAGVEHLLRNVKDATISTLASDVSAKLQALKGLKGRLADVQEYLGAVLEGKLPVNNDIMTYLQVIT
jgi:26S proteasome regulatory subunit N8